jgi:nicotinamide riboside transporter PnuC
LRSISSWKYSPGTIWPGQIIAYLLGAAALFFAVKKTKHSGKMIGAILSCLWNGIAYHISFFSRINKAAFAFGILFILELWGTCSVTGFRIHRFSESALKWITPFSARRKSNKMAMKRGIRLRNIDR